MRKHIIKLFFIAIAAASLTSCKNDTSDLVSDQTLGHCLSVAKDVTTHAQCTSRMSFSAQYNYSNNTVDLAITGVVIPQAGSTTGLRFPKMSFSSLPWNYNESGWKVVEIENVKPEITGITAVPEFKKLKFMLLDAFNGNTYEPGIMYKFEIEADGTDAELVGCCMTGKTVSSAGETVYVPEEDTSLAEDKRPIYWVDFNFKTSKADIYIFNAKFLNRMPSLNMTFENVDFTMSNGEVTLSCDSLTPNCEGVPFPSFPISKLKGTVNYSEGMKLEFHCDYRGTDYTVKFEGKY